MAGYQANQQQHNQQSSSHSINHEPRPSHSKPIPPPPSTNDREALPPPPQRDPKPNQRDNPPPPVSFPTPADFRRSSSSAAAALAGSQVLSHAKDDDETDDEDVPSRGNTDSGSVEDVCLGCEGQCRCGGAKGATVYLAADRARGLKVRITLSSASTPVVSTSVARASASTSSAIASTSTLPPSYPHQRPRHVSFSDSSSDEYAPQRQQKKQKLSTSTGARKVKAAPVASGSGTVVGASTAPPRKRGRPRKYPHPDDAPFAAAAPHRKGATSTSPQARRKNARPLPQPSRSSLRQVLAASVKDADVPVLTMESPPRERLSDVSDLELEDSEGDEGIERAEEKALREEFEKGDEGSSSGEDDDDLTDWEEMELAAAKQAKREGSVVVAEEDEDVTVTDIPASGGRGVVTWSDYDSINEEEDDEEDQEEGERERDEDDEDDDVAGEFEDELEELLAISEAVVGPVRDDEYELGEMWFEEISNLGDDETDSADEESGGEEEEGGQTLVIVDAWGGASFRHVDESGSSGDDDESDFDDQMNYDSEDGGDTTDSLDSDDHVGLVRFGIEVDTDSSSESDSDGGEFYRFAPGTASLADVQAPTSADLASLPQYLFTGADSLGMTINLQGLDDDPERAIREAAEGYGFGATDNGIRVVDGQFSAAAKGKGKARIQDIREEDEAGTESDGVGGMKSPAMGCFGPADSGRAAELTVVIDGSDNVAPSPFSKVKKGKKRGRQQLLDGTPSRRVRADSKVSTASGRSITDGSLSGEVADVASPFLASTAMDLELADVLNDSILHEPSSGSPSSDDSDAEVADGLRNASATGLSDLSRWNRIPIGAFRSSTMPSSQQTAQYFSATADEAVAGYNGRRGSAGGTLYLPVPGAVLRGTRVGSSLSHTLSSPHTTSSTTKRAIERRMLTSPVFGPAIVGGAASSPKSRKVKRKEKKAQSSTTVRVTSPKQAFTSSGATSFGTPQIA